MLLFWFRWSNYCGYMFSFENRAGLFISVRIPMTVWNAAIARPTGSMDKNNSVCINRVHTSISTEYMCTYAKSETDVREHRMSILGDFSTELRQAANVLWLALADGRVFLCAEFSRISSDNLLLCRRQVGPSVNVGWSTLVEARFDNSQIRVLVLIMPTLKINRLHR